MYRVFLVDDEIVVREGIRDNVKWQNTNFIFSGEAQDGEIALPLIQEIKPDILLTDIKMPFMDGLQLTKIVRKSMPWIKVIILSGHDEFKYAKEAIQIGVTEYLLKPVASGDLIEALDRVALQIEKEKREAEAVEKLKSQLEQHTFLLRDKFLERLVQGMIPILDIIDGCAKFKIDIIAKYYLAVIIEVEIYENNNLTKEPSEFLKAQVVINDIVNKDEDIISFSKSTDEIVLILKGDSESSLNEKSYVVGQAIKYEAERSTSCKLAISIGKPRERLQGISLSYKDADKVRDYKYVYGRNKILSSSDVKSGGGFEKKFIKIERNNVKEFMKCGSRSEIGQFIEQYINGLNEAEIKSPIYFYYLFVDLVLGASDVIQELGEKIENVIPEIVCFESLLADIDSIERFKELVESVTSKVIDFRESKSLNKYCNIIVKAKEYIDSNFSNHDISLNSVASHVNVSPSHFSTIFSQETGENFIEYLTKVRMKKAMMLLRMTAQKSAEIAYSVGYNDPHYFSYIFKKTVGITPKEYRNET